MTADLTPNIPLLRKAVEWAEAEAAKPEAECLWNQGAWSRQTDCGTAFCIAGFVAQVTDARYVNNYYVEGVELPTAAEAALGLPPHRCTCGCGSTYPDQQPLFDAHNSIADVRRIAEEIAGERL